MPVFPTRPVDTTRPEAHIARVKKKSPKVGESKAAYAAKKPMKAHALPKKASFDSAEFKRITGKLFAERKELLHKLAQ